MKLPLLEQAASARSKIQYFIDHERSVKSEDHFANEAPDKQKLIAAQRLSRDLVAGATEAHGGEFARDMVDHTEARMNALWTGQDRRESLDAGPIREKHKIGHQAYANLADVGVHPSLVKRKDGDAAEMRKMKKLAGVAGEVAAHAGTIASKDATAKQVKDARANLMKHLDALRDHLNVAAK